MINDQEFHIIHNDSILNIKEKVANVVSVGLNERNATYGYTKFIHTNEYLIYDQNGKCIDTTIQPYGYAAISHAFDVNDLNNDVQIEIWINDLKDSIFRPIVANNEYIYEHDQPNLLYYISLTPFKTFFSYNGLLDKQLCTFSFESIWFI